MHRILICGDRNYGKSSNQKICQKNIEETLTLWNLEEIECIIQGECPYGGADYLAKMVAQKLHIPVLSFPADWKTYGKRAGPIRNMQMLKEGKPTVVIAFHDDIETSKGTKHMMTIAKKEGIPVYLYSNGELEER